MQFCYLIRKVIPNKLFTLVVGIYLFISSFVRGRVCMEKELSFTFFWQTVVLVEKLVV